MTTMEALEAKQQERDHDKRAISPARELPGKMTKRVRTLWALLIPPIGDTRQFRPESVQHRIHFLFDAKDVGATFTAGRYEYGPSSVETASSRVCSS